MSGISLGAKLADQLRFEADELNNAADRAKINRIYKAANSACRGAAKAGYYSIKFFDDQLDDLSLVKALTNALNEDGFKVSVVQEDTAYSEHAGKTMLYINISW